MLTGSLKSEADYETATEIAIQLGFPTEAQTIALKGVDARQSRGSRLIAMAKTQAAADAAALAKEAAAAAAAKSGDASVKLGENYWGQGRDQDAVTAIKAGIAKGTTNPDVRRFVSAWPISGCISATLPCMRCPRFPSGRRHTPRRSPISGRSTPARIKRRPFAPYRTPLPPAEEGFLFGARRSRGFAMTFPHTLRAGARP